MVISSFLAGGLQQDAEKARTACWRARLRKMVARFRILLERPHGASLADELRSGDLSIFGSS
jgi:hypothetical protein